MTSVHTNLCTRSTYLRGKLCECQSLPLIIFMALLKYVFETQKTHKRVSWIQKVFFHTAQMIETKHKVDTGAQAAKHTMPCVLLIA